MVASTAPAAAGLDDAFARIWRRTGPPLPPDELEADPAECGSSTARVVAGPPRPARASRPGQPPAPGAPGPPWVTHPDPIAPPPPHTPPLRPAPGRAGLGPLR